MGSGLRAAADHAAASVNANNDSTTGGSHGPHLSLEMEQGRESPVIDQAAGDGTNHDAAAPDPGTEPAGEEFAENEYLHLIRWAMHKAPELLRALKTTYLFRNDANATPDSQTPDNQTGTREFDASRLRARSSWRSSLFGIARPSDKLQDVEREHIRRILRESATAVEAALKLGINNSTLWRKRKRYNL